MRARTVMVFFLMVTTLSFGQDKKSKGDILFFEYAYKAAIQEYNKEKKKKPLTNQQLLNLADAYYQTGNYKGASENYIEVYKKEEPFSNHYFNKMLLSLGRTSGTDRVKAFLASKTTPLPEELLENANFNFELLGSKDAFELDFELFNITGNSPQSDFSPTFYKDRLLFTSGRGKDSKSVYAPSGEAYLDIFVARMENNGDIGTANRFTDVPDSEFHKATPFYSTDLNSLFYILSNAEDGQMAFDNNGKNALAIGKVDENGTFGFLLRDLSTSFYYPFYDAANEKLYFAANFYDSYGGTDLYYVYTNKGQIMSAPINLGPRINSAGNEIAPFIFDNSLYFASDVFYGLGGMDIYKSNFQSDTSYSIPINLGLGINSSADDFGFIIKDDGTTGLLGYFSSNRKGGKGGDDIYGFRVAEKPGLKTLVFKGKVSRLGSKLGVDKVSIKLFDSDNNLITEVYTREDGAYQLEIPWVDQVVLTASKERHELFSRAYDKAALETKEATLDIDLTMLDDLVEEKEEQTILKLNDFFFAKGKWEVTPAIALELDKVVLAVQKFPELQLRIEAHTDSRGGSSTNFRLSQNRANGIRDYLIQKGVPTTNLLYAVGYGEDKILNNCTNGVFCIEQLHKVNERCLIVILNYNLL
ncbi:OmpA family protein [Flavobacteriaceae bacterium 3-367]